MTAHGEPFRDVGMFNYDVQSWFVVSNTVANCLP
jgi:hypothetical protein